MLNEKARQIFQYIVRCGRERGFPPTLREIGEAFGITSTNGVRYYLGVLEREGFLKRSGRISRGMELPEGAVKRFARVYGHGETGAEERGWTGIPILGRVAAGAPLLATENIEGELDLESTFPSSEPRFALRIQGDSMRDAGILHGDLVVVRRAEQADSGDIVVALMGEEATVKTYERHPDRVILRPANPAYSPMQVQAGEELRILGVVIGLVRPTPSIRARAMKSG